MSTLRATYSRTILQAVLDLLVPLLLTAAEGNLSDAIEEVLAMLDDFHPATREELFLASEVISFRLNGLGTLRDASAPETPPALAQNLLKLGNALRRSEAAAQRKLDSLQRARRKAQAAEAPAEADAPHPDHRPEPDAAHQPSLADAQPASPELMPAAGLKIAMEAARAVLMRTIGDDPALLAQLRQDGLLDCLSDDHDVDDGMPALPSRIEAAAHPAVATA
jgi:hypothetical protein